MINIKRNNYEEYFMDYLDENLSQSDKQTFMLFLEQNPDLKEELEMVRQGALVPDEVVFKGKQELKRKNILTSGHHFDELCITSIEGDLTKTEQSKFDAYLHQNIEKQEEFFVFTKTKLKADETIVFQEKERLKKKESKRFKRRTISILSAAASIVILVGLYFLIPKKNNYTNHNNVSQQTIVKHNTEKTKTNKPATTKQIDQELEDIESLEPIEKELLSEVKVEEYLIVDIDNNQDNRINIEEKNSPVPEKLKSAEIRFDYKKEVRIVYLADVSLPDIEMENKSVQEDSYHTLRTFLASAFNKRLLNKEEKHRIELFDLAQAGVKGINKLTGSNMKLERKFDQNGKLDKTEFNSRLIAFSAPVKKK